MVASRQQKSQHITRKCDAKKVRKVTFTSISPRSRSDVAKPPQNTCLASWLQFGFAVNPTNRINLNSKPTPTKCGRSIYTRSTATKWIQNAIAFLGIGQNGAEGEFNREHCVIRTE